jgi:hypothetical protein
MQQSVEPDSTNIGRVCPLAYRSADRQSMFHEEETR